MTVIMMMIMIREKYVEKYHEYTNFTKGKKSLKSLHKTASERVNIDEVSQLDQ